MLTSLLLVVSLILFVVGTGLMISTYRDLNASSATLGTTVELIPHTDNDGTTYQSVISYEVDGTLYRHITSSSSSPPMHEVGERVYIAYHRHNPRESRILTFMRTYGKLLLLLYGTVVICVLTSFSLFFGDRLMRWLHPGLY